MLVVSVVCSTSRRSNGRAHLHSCSLSVECRCHCAVPGAHSCSAAFHVSPCGVFCRLLCIFCHVTISIYSRIYIPTMTHPLDRFPLTPSVSTFLRGLLAKLLIHVVLNAFLSPWNYLFFWKKSRTLTAEGVIELSGLVSRWRRFCPWAKMVCKERCN